MPPDEPTLRRDVIDLLVQGGVPPLEAFSFVRDLDGADIRRLRALIT